MRLIIMQWTENKNRLMASVGECKDFYEYIFVLQNFIRLLLGFSG